MREIYTGSGSSGRFILHFLLDRIGPARFHLLTVYLVERFRRNLEEDPRRRGRESRRGLVGAARW